MQTENKMNLPNISQIVIFQGREYKILHINLGGKCRIKKMLLPNKGKVLSEININELTFLN